MSSSATKAKYPSVLTTGAYALSQNRDTDESKEYLFVELTDSAIRAIEEYQQNAQANRLASGQRATIQFIGDSGFVQFPTPEGVEGRKFGFAIHDDSGSLECLQQKQRDLDVLGSMSCQMRVHENEDFNEKSELGFETQKSECVSEMKSEQTVNEGSLNGERLLAASLQSGNDSRSGSNLSKPISTGSSMPIGISKSRLSAATDISRSPNMSLLEDGVSTGVDGSKDNRYVSYAQNTRTYAAASSPTLSATLGGNMTNSCASVKEKESSINGSSGALGGGAKYNLDNGHSHFLDGAEANFSCSPALVGAEVESFCKASPSGNYASRNGGENSNTTGSSPAQVVDIGMGEGRNNESSDDLKRSSLDEDGYEDTLLSGTQSKKQCISQVKEDALVVTSGSSSLMANIGYESNSSDLSSQSNISNAADSPLLLSNNILHNFSDFWSYIERTNSSNGCTVSESMISRNLSDEQRTTTSGENYSVSAISSDFDMTNCSEKSNVAASSTTVYSGSFVPEAKVTNNGGCIGNAFNASYQCMLPNHHNPSVSYQQQHAPTTQQVTVATNSCATPAATESNPETQSKCDFSKYTPIKTIEQRRLYKADFESDYDEYCKLLTEIRSVGRRFCGLSEMLENVRQDCPLYYDIKDQIVSEYERIRNDENLKRDKQRLDYLQRRLAFIKKRVEDFDKTAIRTAEAITVTPTAADTIITMANKTVHEKCQILDVQLIPAAPTG